MTKQKSTKRALLASVLSLVLCISMLVGSTFAWFTDSATTGVNTIQSGNLDVVLEMSKDGKKWEDANGKTLDFIKAAGAEGETVLWEPGAEYKLPKLRITNAGNLALKFKVVVSGLTGDTELADVLDVYVKKGDADKTKVGTLTEVMALNATEVDGMIHGNLAKDTTTDAYEVSLKMKDTANNDYQNKTLSGLAITVYAAQDTVENDSFNNGYDEGAEFPWTKVSTSAAEYATAENGNTTNIFTVTSPVASPVVLDGKDDVVFTTYQDLWVADDVTIKNAAFEEGLRINAKEGSEALTVTVKNCIIKACDQEKLKAANAVNFAAQSRDGLCFDLESNGVAVTLVVKNCVLEGESTADMDRDGYSQYDSSVRNKAGGKGIAIGEMRGNSNGVVSVTIEGCTFNNIRSHAIQLYAGYGSATVKGNTFNGWGYNDECLGAEANARKEYAVRGDLGSGTLTVEDNVFNVEKSDKIGYINVSNFNGNDQ